MGYTHYWYRADREIARDVFKRIVSDFKKLLPRFAELGILLANGSGEGEAVMTDDLVSFNGLKRCSHPGNREFGIAWPAKNAKGIANPWLEDVRSKSWFGGKTLMKRDCSGDCSHETCYFPRVLEKTSHDFSYHPTKEGGKGWNFSCCKTAFKPYDLAVTAFLVIVKHYLKERIWICSDGTTEHWADARILTHEALGYGLEFELDRN